MTKQARLKKRGQAFFEFSKNGNVDFKHLSFLLGVPVDTVKSWKFQYDKSKLPNRKFEYIHHLSALECLRHALSIPDNQKECLKIVDKMQKEVWLLKSEI